MSESLGNGVPRDLVKNDALDGQTADLDCFDQMPGDGLALPVRVGGQIDLSRFLGFSSKLLNHLELFFRDAVRGLKIVFYIHAEPGPEQIAHMTDGGLDPITTAQELAHRACLGWRFNDHQPPVTPGLLPGCLLLFCP